MGILDAPQVELGDIQGMLVAGIALELALEELVFCCAVVNMPMGVGVTAVVELSVEFEVVFWPTTRHAGRSSPTRRTRRGTPTAAGERGVGGVLGFG